MTMRLGALALGMMACVGCSAVPREDFDALKEKVEQLEKRTTSAHQKADDLHQSYKSLDTLESRVKGDVEKTEALAAQWAVIRKDTTVQVDRAYKQLVVVLEDQEKSLRTILSNLQITLAELKKK